MDSNVHRKKAVIEVAEPVVVSIEAASRTDRAGSSTHTEKDALTSKAEVDKRITHRKKNLRTKKSKTKSRQHLRA